MRLIKSFTKRVTYALFAAYGSLRLRWSNKPRLLILTYHRVLPEKHPARLSEQPGMIISPENLHQHINIVSQLGGEFFHLEDWLEKSQNNKALPKLAVAITFDDGWQDNYEFAWPLLTKCGTPATIFLVTDYIGESQSFWPEQVIRLLTKCQVQDYVHLAQWLEPYIERGLRSFQSPLSISEADLVVDRLKALDDKSILAELAKVYWNHPELKPSSHDRAILSEDELKKMSRNGTFKYGAHTKNHYRLNLIKDKNLLEEEIVGSLDDLQRLTTASTPIFCYPNGDITNAGRELVERFFIAACTTKTGLNYLGCNPFSLKRFNLHDGNSGTRTMLLGTIGRNLL